MKNKNKKNKLSAKQIDKMFALRMKGMSYVNIGKKIPCHATTVFYHIHK